MARLGRSAAIKEATALRAAFRRSPRQFSKSPSSKRRSRARGTTNVESAALEAVEETAESSEKQRIDLGAGPPVSKSSKALAQATVTKDLEPRKLSPLGSTAIKESASGSPSMPVRRSKAASVTVKTKAKGIVPLKTAKKTAAVDSQPSVNDDSAAKGLPHVSAVDKGKRRQVETLEVVKEGAEGRDYSPLTSTSKAKGKGKIIEDVIEIVDESENTAVKPLRAKKGKPRPIEPNDPEAQVLDPSEIIPKMNALVKEDIADLNMINQLQSTVNRVIQDATGILEGCRKETLFRTRLETFLRYSVFNNNAESKARGGPSSPRGRLDTGWTLDEMWSGGAVLIEDPGYEWRLADEDEEEQFWELDDKEIKKIIDKVMPQDSSEEESGSSSEEESGDDELGDEEQVSDDEPASEQSSSSRKRSRDNEETIAHPARRIKV